VAEPGQRRQPAPVRRIVLVLLALVVAGLAALLGATAVMRAAARGRLYADPRLVPHRPVGLLLGCAPRLADGARNPFFENRVAAAVALYRAGRVDRVLASGECGPGGYDESAALRAELLAAGVPPAAILVDPAGDRTLASIECARTVFGQREITVISQAFHNRRAIFLAAHRGVDAIGFDAADVRLGDSFWIHAREPFADVVAVIEGYCRGAPPIRSP